MPQSTKGPRPRAFKLLSSFPVTRRLLRLTERESEHLPRAELETIQPECTLQRTCADLCCRPWPVRGRGWCHGGGIHLVQRDIKRHIATKKCLASGPTGVCYVQCWNSLSVRRGSARITCLDGVVGANHTIDLGGRARQTLARRSRD